MSKTTDKLPLQGARKSSSLFDTLEIDDEHIGNNRLIIIILYSVSC